MRIGYHSFQFIDANFVLYCAHWNTIHLPRYFGQVGISQSAVHADHRFDLKSQIVHRPQNAATVSLRNRDL